MNGTQRRKECWLTVRDSLFNNLSLRFHLGNRIAVKCNFQCEFRLFSTISSVFTMFGRWCKCLFFLVVFFVYHCIFPSTTITLSASNICVSHSEQWIKIHFVHISLFDPLIYHTIFTDASSIISSRPVLPSWSNVYTFSFHLMFFMQCFPLAKHFRLKINKMSFRCGSFQFNYFHVGFPLENRLNFNFIVMNTHSQNHR